MSDGINTAGFDKTGEQSGSNNIDAKYAPNPKPSFPAKDVSNQPTAEGPK
jgi:hypothetical protein